MEFSEKLKDFFLKNSRFRQLELVTVAEKSPKKPEIWSHDRKLTIAGLPADNDDLLLDPARVLP